MGVKEPGAGHWASLWQVANRAREMRGVANGAALADAVDALAQSHVDALTPRIEKGEPGPWVIHFQRFLVDFEGVPARDAFAEKHAKLFKKHQSAAVSGFRKYYRKRAKDPAEAFAGGVEGFSKGFLHWECDDVFSGLEAMAKKGKKLKIHPKVLSAYKKKVAWYAKAVAKGNKEYVKVNRSAKLK